MKIGIVVHKPLFDSLFLPQDQVRLQTLGEIIQTDSPKPLTVEEACTLLASCDIAIGSWNSPYPNPAIMAACPDLKLWEHAAGTVKHMFGAHLQGRDMVIASCKTAIADCVAEMVLAEIILGLRQVFPNAQANRGGITGKPPGVRTLFGATIGVIAASEVGRRVIDHLKMFPCRILLYDPFVTEERAAQMGVTVVRDLLELCAQSDVVTLHTPNIPETKRMLQAAHFRAMPDHAVVINTSRGDCLDEGELIAELQKGRLFAFLDVSAPEPAVVDSPLRSLPNVVYTSHIAGPPAYNLGRQAVDDVEKFGRGEQPLCVITEEMLPYIG